MSIAEITVGVEDVVVVSAKRRQRWWPYRNLSRNLGIVWIAAVVGLALLAPLLGLRKPNQGGYGIAKPPFGANFLGTDNLGRDEFVRVIYGARISLLISAASIGIAVVIGVSLGLYGGYVRGKIDTLVTGVADIVLAFPPLVLLLVVSALAGPSLHNLIYSIAVLKIPAFIRLSRANTLAFAQRDFVKAAKGIGERGPAIAIGEILPNVIPGVVAYAMAAIAEVFVLEGSLSFLGVGIQPPTAAWGSMISAGEPMLVRSPHIVLVPAIALFVTVLALNALSDSRRGNLRAQGTK